MGTKLEYHPALMFGVALAHLSLCIYAPLIPKVFSLSLPTRSNITGSNQTDRSFQV